MKKIMAAGLFPLLLTSAWAAEVHRFAPEKNPVPRIETKSLKPKFEKKFSTPGTLVQGGGYGGNIRIGKHTHDGSPGNFPTFNFFRTMEGECFTSNSNVHIIDYKTEETIYFSCPLADPKHHYLIWSGYLGQNNGGYSPENDVMYATDVLTRMFFEWYSIPPIMGKFGLHQPIEVVLHEKYDDAYIKGSEIILGDGVKEFHPLTSLSVISYMVGWVFTEQHAKLWGNLEATGISMAFNSMTAMAAEYYTTGRNTWEVGADATKSGKAMYYLDVPSKDCYGKKPGEWCSIDAIWQYNANIIDKFSSGIYRRAFYLLATSKGWNTHKAYDVFVHANRYLWDKNTTFQSGACDAVTAAHALHYDVMSVMLAFADVGIDTRSCSI